MKNTLIPFNTLMFNSSKRSWPGKRFTEEGVHCARRKAFEIYHQTMISVSVPLTSSTIPTAVGSPLTQGSTDLIETGKSHVVISDHN